MGDRVVIVIGPAEARVNAIHGALGTAFNRDDPNAVLKLLVPADKAGAVVGKKGATLQTVRQQTGVNVQFEKQEVAGERLLHVTAAPSQACAVVRMIIGILDNAPARDGGSQASNGSRPPQPPPAPGDPFGAWSGGGGGGGGGGFNSGGYNGGDFGSQQDWEYGSPP